jgi:hypothetical protein
VGEGAPVVLPDALRIFVVFSKKSRHSPSLRDLEVALYLFRRIDGFSFIDQSSESLCGSG